MPRLILLVGPPYHLKPAEAEDWLRAEAARLASADGVQRGDLSRVAPVSQRSTTEWGWLIELHCESADGAHQAISGHAWSEVLGDLRLLGMRPAVALVVRSGELPG